MFHAFYVCYASIKSLFLKICGKPEKYIACFGHEMSFKAVMKQRSMNSSANGE